MKTTRLTRTFAVIGLLSMTLAMSGCGAKDQIDDAVNDGLNEAVDKASEAAEQASDAIAESDAEDILNELMTDGAEVDLGVDGDASVPDNFPAGLPVPSGDLVLAIADGGTWNLSYTVSSADEAESLADWYASKPEYMAQDQIDSDGMHIWAFIGPKYYVNVALLTGADGSLSLIYGVTEGTE